jgi:hypothetical protein
MESPCYQGPGSGLRIYFSDGYGISPPKKEILPAIAERNEIIEE